MRYRYNCYCTCARCRCHGYMGPAVLITLGVLFLFDQMGHAHWMDFSYTWPMLLIVIGLIKLLEHGASSEGHIPREYSANLPPNPGQPIPPGTAAYTVPQPPPVAPAPPVQPAGFIAPAPSEKGPGDRGGA